MLKDFITNASLLVTVFFMIGQIFKDHPLTRSSSLQLKLAAGLCFGLQSTLLIIYSVRINPHVIVDMRHIPVLVAAMQGGPVAGLVAALTAGWGRIGLFGLSTSSLSSSLMLVFISLASGFANCKARTSTLKHFIGLNTATLVLTSVVIGLNMHMFDSMSKVISVLGLYWVISMTIGVLSVSAYLYIVRSHASTRHLQESEERYRQLIAASPDATLVLIEPNIAFVNERALSMLGAASSGELLDRPYLNIVEPSGHEAVRQNQAALRSASKLEQVEQRFVRRDGRIIDVELSVSRITYESQRALLVTARDITDRKLTELKLQEALDTLQKLSDLDGLTGIPNRRKFDECLNAAWLSAQASRQPLTLLLFDVDYFKAYNDTYGHLGGDEVLRTIAQAAVEVLGRRSFFLARYGGEEFAAILAGITPEAALDAAEALRAQVEALDLPHNKADSGVITVSVGAATVRPSGSETPESLILLADQALYRAKDQGRNRVAQAAFATVDKS